MLYFGPWSADNKHIISVINFPSTTLHPKMIYKKDFLLCGLLTNVIRFQPYCSTKKINLLQTLRQCFEFSIFIEVDYIWVLRGKFVSCVIVGAQ